MTHKYVYERFKFYFPQYAERTTEWFPNGKDSVRVCLSNKQQFIFSLVGKIGMRFETIDSYIERMKGGSKK